MLNSLPRFFSGISEVVEVVGTQRLFAMGFLGWAALYSFFYGWFCRVVKKL